MKECIVIEWQIVESPFNTVMQTRTKRQYQLITDRKDTEPFLKKLFADPKVIDIVIYEMETKHETKPECTINW